MTTVHDVYVTTLSVEDIFADYTYQRELDAPRVKRMAAEWNRRLVGIVEVSDRGTFATPRYAVVDGQHRWAAARLLDPAPMLVVNVHEGLTVDEEAQLFDGLNRNRKQTNTWDHWKARFTEIGFDTGRVGVAAAAEWLPQQYAAMGVHTDFQWLFCWRDTVGDGGKYGLVDAADKPKTALFAAVKPLLGDR